MKEYHLELKWRGKRRAPASAPVEFWAQFETIERARKVKKLYEKDVVLFKGEKVVIIDDETKEEVK